MTKKVRNIFFVGDPDQSIYRFRGAMPDTFSKFEEHFNDAQIYKLTENYRSTQEILDVANKLISCNDRGRFAKDLKASRIHHGKAEKVKYFETNDVKKEVDFVMKKIWELDAKGVALSEIAVIYRNNVFGKNINRMFISKKIPFFSQELLVYTRKREVKDFRAWLNIGIEKDIKRLNKSIDRVIVNYGKGIGEKLYAEIKELSEENEGNLEWAIKVHPNEYVRKFWKIICDVREISEMDNNSVQSSKEKIEGILNICGFWNYWERQKGGEERAENVRSVIDYVFGGDGDRGLSVDQILQNLNGLSRPEDGCIHSGTIHGVKGLEFDYVFLVNVSQGKLPSSLSLNPRDPEDLSENIKEERRLTYVAFTRARKQLFITNHSGQEKTSIFIKEVIDLLDKEVDYTLKRKNASNAREEKEELIITKDEDLDFFDEWRNDE